jgi:hypothetical protein
MDDAAYVDLQILAEVDNDDYLIVMSKKDLNSLISFNEELVVRHWNGEKPVLLETYGEDAVRTEEDEIEGNNLSTLPRVKSSDMIIAR